jgi:hypothetical protein
LKFSDLAATRMTVPCSGRLQEQAVRETRR